MLASFCLLWKGALFRPKGCDFLLCEIQKNGEMTVIALYNDTCQCFLLRTDSVILTKYGGMEGGFELSSATSAVISCYKKTVIAVIPLKCFWHCRCMKRTGIFVLFIVKGLSLFPLVQSVEPLMSTVLPLFDFVLHQSKWGNEVTTGDPVVSENMVGTWGSTRDQDMHDVSEFLLYRHLELKNGANARWPFVP